MMRNPLVARVAAAYLEKQAAREWKAFEDFGYALGVVRGEIPAYQNGVSRYFWLKRGEAYLKKLAPTFVAKWGRAKYTSLLQLWSVYTDLIERLQKAEDEESNARIAIEEANDKTRYWREFFIDKRIQDDALLAKTAGGIHLDRDIQAALLGYLQNSIEHTRSIREAAKEVAKILVWEDENTWKNHANDAATKFVTEFYRAHPTMLKAREEERVKLPGAAYLKRYEDRLETFIAQFTFAPR